MLPKFLREPLLHFLLIGAALFLFYSLQNDNRTDSNLIVFDEARINHLATLWKKTNQRLPTQAELESMIQQQIREEVMYREALALKLDRNDSIIRRRLAQKIEFISADLSALAEPTDTQLADYLKIHGEEFELPARINFSQVFIDPEKHSDNADDYVSTLLIELNNANSNSDIATLGDSLMLDQQYEQASAFELSRLFGEDFANELFAQSIDKWLGPIASGYGWHLVKITNKTESLLPELEAVRYRVKDAWLTEQQRIMDETFYKTLLQRYEIIVAKPAAGTTLLSTAQ